MNAGILNYILPSIPPSGFVAFVNGIQTNCTVDGVNLTITDYTAGEIEDTDLLTVFF